LISRATIGFWSRTLLHGVGSV